MHNLDKDSKYLSFLLRHHPEKANLHMDSLGYVDVEELVRNTRIDRDELQEIVDTDLKKRYSYNEDKTKIRANQGHSVEGINPGLLEKVPPEVLYHGTSRKNWVAIIDSQMIKPMGRNLVHLSSDVETAIKVGKRRDDKPVVLVIDALEAYERGNKFYLSENNVWLTDNVDIKYVTVLNQ